jgi:hypothetical protein
VVLTLLDPTAVSLTLVNKQGGETGHLLRK